MPKSADGDNKNNEEIKVTTKNNETKANDKGNGAQAKPATKTAAPKKAAAKKKPAKKKPAKKKTASDEPRMVLLTDITVREGANPRREIDKKSLDELTASIKVFGVLQPIGLAPREEDDKLELLWGERRLRAAQALKMKEIPAVIKSGRTREDHYVMRMMENLQRENLNAVDEAVAFQNYLTATKKTAKDLAESLGVKPAYISQRLKILKMPSELQLALSKDEINFTQARELSRMDPKDQVKTLNRMAKGEVTKAEDITRAVEKKRAKKRAAASDKADGKKRGRPARTKENAPDIVRQNLDNAIEALNNFAIESKPKTQMRDGLITLYERFTNCRSDTKKEQLRGAVKTLEWALGIRDDL
jgi:ParB/RepB/Spo0J family partition protein